MRIDQALAWASELPKAYADLEASAAVGQAIGAWYLGPYRCLRHEGRTLLIRRQNTSGMRKLAVLVLDEAGWWTWPGRSASMWTHGSWSSPMLTAPGKLAWQIPTAVVAERSGSEDIGLALWLAAAAGIAMVLGVVALTRLRRHLARERAFTAAASHELRTPVAALRALAENLVRGIVTDPERQQTYLRTLHDPGDPPRHPGRQPAGPKPPGPGASGGGCPTQLHRCNLSTTGRGTTAGRSTWMALPTALRQTLRSPAHGHRPLGQRS